MNYKIIFCCICATCACFSTGDQFIYITESTGVQCEVSKLNFYQLLSLILWCQKHYIKLHNQFLHWAITSRFFSISMTKLNEQYIRKKCLLLTFESLRLYGFWVFKNCLLNLGALLEILQFVNLHRTCHMSVMSLLFTSCLVRQPLGSTLFWGLKFFFQWILFASIPNLQNILVGSLSALGNLR